MKNTTKYVYGLGVASVDDEVLVFLRDTEKADNTFQINSSKDGYTFEVLSTAAKILGINIPVENIEYCQDFRLAKVEEEYILTYVINDGVRSYLSFARSKDLINWEKMSRFPDVGEVGMIAPHTTHNKKRILYFGEKDLSVAYSDDLRKWTIEKTAVLTLPKKEQQDHLMKIATIQHIEEGILVVYFVYKPGRSASDCSIRIALFDKKDPTKILWRSNKPIRKISNKNGNLVLPLGLVVLADRFVSYWQGQGGKLYTLNHYYPKTKRFSEESKEETSETEPQLERQEENPIMSPKQQHAWESKAVFNPAAMYEGDKVHLIYRAIGDNDVSVLGYAESEDGITITKRLPYPAYIPREPFEGVPVGNTQTQCAFSPYMSGGGGSGGCEDPKLTKIDDTVYLTYVAYNGWGPPRIAMSWIGLKDFLNHRWTWSKPVLLSKPDVVDKSPCILPEKVNGKYVIFHRVFPNVLVDFVDDLEKFDGETVFLEGEHKIEPRDDAWDSGKFSIGATPIKTKDGWLVIYHAVTGRQEWPGSDLRYKIGAMLLDLNDPSKVLYRCNEPILVPETEYENNGAKYGVVYPCGAVAKDGTLYVYYGGSDMYVCVATAPLDTFLEDLKNSGTAKLEIQEKKQRLAKNNR